MNIGEGYSWVQALGWSLVHFLWQGALVGICFAFARTLIPKEHSAVRYASGLFALGVLAVCPLVTLWSLRPATTVLGGDGLGVSGVVAPASGLAATDATIVDMNGVLPVLVVVWIAGVVVMFARAVHQWRALDRIATRLAWRRADIEALLQSVAARFGGVARVRVLISQHIDTPTLIGWFNPVILLPVAVVLGFPRKQLELILAHELGHLRRHDHLVNLGQAVIETLLFYHPVVHWISREVRHEREVCCDNLVLHLTEGEPREYARTLAALEDLRQLPPQLAVAASGGMLLDRVRRIIGSSPPRNSHGRSRFGIWMIVVAAVASLTLMMHVSRRDAESSSIVFAYPVPAGSLRANTTVLPDFRVAAAHAFEWASLPPLRGTSNMAEGMPAAIRPAASAPVEPADATIGGPVVLLYPGAQSVPDSARVPLPEVADVVVMPIEAAKPRIEAAPVRASSAPTLVRRVDPVYPDVNMTASRGHVEFEFAIDDAGHVRDISVVSGDSLGAFAVAARRALRQWRFAPYRVQAHAGERFRQDFVFVGVSQKVAVSDDPICLRGTGSHLCRPDRGAGVTTEIDVVKPAIATRSVATSNDVRQPVRRDIVEPAAMPAGAGIPQPGAGGGTN